MQALRRLKRKEDPATPEPGTPAAQPEAVEPKRGGLGTFLGLPKPEDGRKSPGRLRVPWKRRGDRTSEESARSSLSVSVGGGHTPSSSIGGASSLRAPDTPFPMIRSQSSISGVNSPPMEQRGRSLTEGEHPLALVPSDTPKPIEDPSLPSFSPDTDPAEFLRAVEAQNREGRLCSALAAQNSRFLKTVMHLYVSKQFVFVAEPIDIALRKFLLVVKLPLETQQTERVLECFSQVYHEQNPTVFTDAQQAYFVVFSIVILHTDFFNKNVKHKMSKEDYVRSAYCEDIPIEFFEYVYENTTCAQFIHAEDPDASSFRRNSSTPTPTIGGSDTESRRSTSFGWRSELMVDPYIPILEGNVEVMRPNLNSVVATKDPFRPCLVDSPLQFQRLRERFVEGPTVQLVSQRSRPDAWQSDVEDRARLSTQNLLQITTPGVVEIKVVKIGIVMRREAPKRMIYSKASWKEWGALLTESQLYLFKNSAWIKTVLSTENGPIIRAPIDEFNATTVTSTKDMAAMFVEPMQGERSHQFSLTGRGGSQQWFAAVDADEATDWIHNINFAAAFSTYHVGPVPSARLATQHAYHPLLRSASDSTLNLAPQRRMRSSVLQHHLQEIDRKLAQLQEQINVIERDSTNLQMLMPLQQKTKEMVMFAVGQCSSKCEYCWQERARLRCYRSMLELDLRCEEDFDDSIYVDCPSTIGYKESSSESSLISTVSASASAGRGAPNRADDSSSPTPRSPIQGSPALRQFSYVQLNPDLGSPRGSPRGSTKSIPSISKV